MDDQEFGEVCRSAHSAADNWLCCSAQALQDRFGGWNSDQIVPIFAQYAATIFQALSDYTMHWTTVNEPWTFCFLGYGQGSGAPGINDKVGSPQ